MVMRVLLGLGFVLAFTATVLVVFSQEIRWLRLAVLLGVWAALACAFALAMSRRDVGDAERMTEEGQLVYERELEREVSARREFEVGLVEGAREEAQTGYREELAGLREQLDRLNKTLSSLLDGDLLVERLTLSAESTRVRQVGDTGRTWLSTMTRREQVDPSTPPATVVEAASGPDAEPDTADDDARPDSGHSAGISVAELVAAYGSGGTTPRRRRRAAE